MESELRARLDRLTLEQKVTLLTGADFWSLNPLPEAGLGAIVVSDGPSGVRGTAWDERQTSLLFPNGSSLSATWDPSCARNAGWLMGAQARDKGVHVLLAPTINLHRTPLGGRHFECYSEDPLLTAEIAKGFVAGLQSTGVAATLKHFVGNETETSRMTYDAVIDEAALRELYLAPFENTEAWLVMAAYNGVNGTTMTENRRLLTDVLKGEWGFDGVVISDWMAARTTEETAAAGLDLVMPGPRGPWGDKLVAAVHEGRVAESIIDDKVLRLLRLAARVGALEGFAPPARVSVPADASARLRALAARSMVLLRNDGVLPLISPRRLALIGPNAVRLSVQGGGSAHVNPPDVVTPLEGLRTALGEDAQISVHTGVYSHRLLPPLPLERARDPETGEPGFRVEFRDADGTLLGTEQRYAARLVFMDSAPAGTHSITMRTLLTVAEDGAHEISVQGAGEYGVRVGDSDELALVLAVESGDLIEGLVRPPEHRVVTTLSAGQTTELALRFTMPEKMPFGALGLGYQPPSLPEDAELAAAVEAARTADVAIVVVGTTEDVESEGFDRETLRLPGRQDELVARVAEANPRTVVVVNAGAPVLMPWVDRVAAVLWAWLPGQEGGDAIAHVLTGLAEPGGRLPTTFPLADADPAATRPVDGQVVYAESTRTGYRASAAAAFPFGFGLGYTTWSYDELTVTPDDGGLRIDVFVRNTGDRPGHEVVQCYLGDRLVGFATVHADPGEEATAHISVGPRTRSRFDPAMGWVVLSGVHRLHVGRSSGDLPLGATVAL